MTDLRTGDAELGLMADTVVGCDALIISNSMLEV